MAVRLYSGSMGLPVLIPGCVYLTTSATPNAVLSMVPEIPGTVQTDGVTVTIPTSFKQNAGSNANVATYTSANPHGLRAGMTVTVSGASDARFNISANVISVTSATVFTYYIATGASTGALAAACTFTCQFQRAILIAADGNNANNDIFFGPNPNADFDHIPAKGAYTLEAPTGSKLDLSDYSFKSASASQNLRVYIV